MTSFKHFNMKSLLNYRLMLFIAVTGLLAACGSSAEGDKNAQLEKLRAEQAELNKKIAALEAEIAKENPAAVKGRVKEVGITEIAPRKFDYYVKTQGLVESENNILVSAKAMGVVSQVFVKEGQQVTKGQTLAQIDNSVIVRSIESMESQLALAKSVFERQQNLWDQKIGTEVQYLQAKTNKESLEKQISSLREQNEMYRIKSPISGVVDALNVKVGENIAPGMPAARVVNSSELELKAKVSEAYVTRIKKGDRVIVSVPGLKEEIEAKVSFVASTIDPMSRTFNVEVALPSKQVLRPNMTATAKIIFESDPQALVVPVNIIQEINGEKVVYVASQEGERAVAKRRVVQVEGVYGSDAQVKGLASGDKLITVGYQGLNDGDAVKI